MVIINIEEEVKVTEAEVSTVGARVVIDLVVGIIEDIEGIITIIIEIIEMIIIIIEEVVVEMIIIIDIRKVIDTVIIVIDMEVAAMMVAEGSARIARKEEIEGVVEMNNSSIIKDIIMMMMIRGVRANKDILKSQLKINKIGEKN